MNRWSMPDPETEGETDLSYESLSAWERSEWLKEKAARRDRSFWRASYFCLTFLIVAFALQGYAPRTPHNYGDDITIGAVVVSALLWPVVFGLSFLWEMGRARR